MSGIARLPTIARAASLAAAMLAMATAACSSALDADGLARTRRAIAATAAEASLLIDEVARGDVTSTYARVHREKLIEHLRDSADDLDRAAPQPLAADADDVRRNGATLEDALRKLGDALGEGDAEPSRSALAALRERFTTIRHDSAARNGT